MATTPNAYESALIGGQWAAPQNLGQAWWNQGKGQSEWTDMPPSSWGTGGAGTGPSGIWQEADPDGIWQEADPEWQRRASQEGSRTPADTPAQGGAPATTNAGANPNPNKYEQGRTYVQMPGWETNKLNDLGHQTTKYDFARAVQTLGIPASQMRGNLQQIADWMKIRGYPNAKVVGDDKVDFGDGFGPVDVITSGGEWWWGSEGGGAGAGGAGGTGSGIGGGGGMGGAADTLFDLLMKRAGQSLELNPNDPIIKGQVDAYNASQQRASRDFMAQQAEKYGANANLTAEARAQAEGVGQKTGAYQATLLGSELAARRAEIENALSGAVGLLTAEQQMALTEELTKIQLAQRAYEFDAELARKIAMGEE